MQIDNILMASLLMESVDILSHEHADLVASLHGGESPVRGVGLSMTN